LDPKIIDEVKTFTKEAKDTPTMEQQVEIFLN